jgi:uncharacterized damage-inducible protein DinB
MRVADIQTLYDYNYWATERILRTAAGVTDEQFATPTRFPWGSLRGTLVHILAGERFWLSRWQGLPAPPPGPHPRGISHAGHAPRAVAARRGRTAILFGEPDGR